MQGTKIVGRKVDLLVGARSLETKRKAAINKGLMQGSSIVLGAGRDGQRWLTGQDLSIESVEFEPIPRPWHGVRCQLDLRYLAGHVQGHNEHPSSTAYRFGRGGAAASSAL